MLPRTRFGNSNCAVIVSSVSLKYFDLLYHRSGDKIHLFLFTFVYVNELAKLLLTFMTMDFTPIFLSLQLAVITTVLLLVIAIPLAGWLSMTKTKLKPLLETLIALPLVLPPTVLGFYLLIAFSPNRGLGAWLDDTLGLRLVFSWGGLVIASMIYSLPFMVQPILAGLRNLDQHIHEASYVLGKSKWQTLRHVSYPNVKPSIWTGVVLSFAHTLGEFGVVLMIGGNIPGETRVASIAIYDQVEALNYAAANTYALILLVLSFVILLTVYYINNRSIMSWR